MTAKKQTRGRRNARSGLGRLALACVLGSSLSVVAEAAPRREPLVSLDGGLLGEDPAPVAEHSCDDVWQQLGAASAPAWSAEISLSQAYQLAGVSSLAPVQEDSLGRFAVRAHLYQGGEPGTVEVRFGRARGAAQYMVWVTTCDSGGQCRASAVQSPRLQCATRRDHATLTVRDVGPHQKVVVSFSR